MFTCSICNKSFNSSFALQGHMRMHGKSNGKSIKILCCCLLSRKEMLVSKLKAFQSRYLKYINNPKLCIECGKPIPYESKTNKFCSQSCSATLTNKLRTKTTKNKTKILVCNECGETYEGSIHTPKNNWKCDNCKNTNKQNFIKYPHSRVPWRTCKNTNKQNFIKYPHSRVPWRTCKHCRQSFISRKILKYCSNCEYLYSTSNRVKYKFTFNIYKYPELFDLKRLKEIGWFSPNGKYGKWNPNGLSRDHKVSVNESIKNGYDPYYISHPLNCELMPHTINNRKKDKSSITYEELVHAVIIYDLNKST